MMALKEEHGTDYTNIEKIELETKNAKELFRFRTGKILRVEGGCHYPRNQILNLFRVVICLQPYLLL